MLLHYNKRSKRFLGDRFMSMLKDKEMKEVVEEFCDESDKLCEQLLDHVDDLEEDPTNNEILELFGQKIDRIMGAAKSLEADKTGKLCELSKKIGYKASQSHDEALLTLVQATLADSVEILQTLIKSIRTEGVEKTDDINLSAFIKRLYWVTEKFKDIERASVSTDEENMDQVEIDSFLKNMKN